MKLSVVILNWNGKHWLEKFLPSVLQHSKGTDIEVVVADNASSDGSVAFLTDKFPQVRQILLTNNFGFAEGYNIALQQVTAEYAILLNSDVEVTDGWWQPLVRALDEDKQLAAVQPKILSYSNKKMFEYAGASGGFLDSYGYPFCRGRIFSAVEMDGGQYDAPMDIFWASGACLAIRTELYKRVGGLDGSFFAHMEEIDLCWRLNARGYRLRCIPQSVVYHVGGGTLSSESPRKTFLNFRNNLLMLYKNVPDSKLTNVMNLRVVLDYLSILHFLLVGKWENAKAVWKARSEFEKIKHSYLPKRIENQKLSVPHHIPVLYRGLVLIPFYLLGKKRFSALY